jgi:hypothetical protein
MLIAFEAAFARTKSTPAAALCDGSARAQLDQLTRP